MNCKQAAHCDLFCDVPGGYPSSRVSSGCIWYLSCHLYYSAGIRGMGTARERRERREMVVDEHNGGHVSVIDRDLANSENGMMHSLNIIYMKWS